MPLWELAYVALALLAAAGPARLAPVVAAASAREPAQRRRFVLRTVGLDAAALLTLVGAGALLRRAWPMSWGAASIALGLLLLFGAVESLRELRPGAEPRGPPTVLTPWGVALALLLCSAAPHPGPRFFVAVVGAMSAVLLLDLGVLLLAPHQARPTTYPWMRVAAWSFAAVLAAIAVQKIAAPVQQLIADLQGDDGDAAVCADRAVLRANTSFQSRGEGASVIADAALGVPPHAGAGAAVSSLNGHAAKG